MITCDFHMHTTYCDGHSSAEEMVLSAVALGLTEIGFSAHSYTPFDESYCINQNRITAYYEEIAALKEKYKDQIRIFFGFEQDYYSDPPPVPVDYLIGSVHYVKCGSDYVPTDGGNEPLRNAARDYFGGDIFAFCEEYYRIEADVVRRTGCDIIGHFDTITKYFEREMLFDLTDERYRRAWKKAIDALLPTGVPFEINTGTISRGYRSNPLPNYELLDYIAANGGSFILSSDSHHADTIAFRFDRYERYARDSGFVLFDSFCALKNRKP